MKCAQRRELSPATVQFICALVSVLPTSVLRFTGPWLWAHAHPVSSFCKRYTVAAAGANFCRCKVCCRGDGDGLPASSCSVAGACIGNASCASACDHPRLATNVELFSFMLWHVWGTRLQFHCACAGHPKEQLLYTSNQHAAQFVQETRECGIHCQPDHRVHKPRGTSLGGLTITCNAGVIGHKPLCERTR